MFVCKRCTAEVPSSHVTYHNFICWDNTAPGIDSNRYAEQSLMKFRPTQLNIISYPQKISIVFERSTPAESVDIFRETKEYPVTRVLLLPSMKDFMIEAVTAKVESITLRHLKMLATNREKILNALKKRPCLLCMRFVTDNCWVYFSMYSQICDRVHFLCSNCIQSTLIENSGINICFSCKNKSGCYKPMLINDKDLC